MSTSFMPSATSTSGNGAASSNLSALAQKGSGLSCFSNLTYARGHIAGIHFCIQLHPWDISTSGSGHVMDNDLMISVHIKDNECT